MMRPYYALFSCDQWKMKNSMNLLGVFNETQLKVAVRKMINSKDFEFESDVREIKNMTPHEMDVHLTYGFIQPVTLNELL